MSSIHVYIFRTYVYTYVCMCTVWSVWVRMVPSLGVSRGTPSFSVLLISSSLFLPLVFTRQQPWLDQYATRLLLPHSGRCIPQKRVTSPRRSKSIDLCSNRVRSSSIDRALTPSTFDWPVNEPRYALLTDWFCCFWNALLPSARISAMDNLFAPWTIMGCSY